MIHQKPFKAETPSKKSVIRNDNHLRIEQPFDHPFDDLKYIGNLDNKAWHVTAHYHDHFELCIISGGEGWFFIDDQLYEVQCGDIFITKPFEVHQGGAAGQEPFQLNFIGFSLSLMNALEIDYFNIGNQRVIRDQDLVIKQLHDQLLQEIDHQKLHNNMMAHGLFLNMLVHVLRLYSRLTHISMKPPKTLTPAIKSILQSLHARITISHRIEELADSIHMSRSHLDREFKKYMGVTIGHYNRTLCLDKAKRLLIESSDSITAIADHLQFDSLYAFSMFFKRYMGMSPKDYRNRRNDEEC